MKTIRCKYFILIIFIVLQQMPITVRASESIDKTKTIKIGYNPNYGTINEPKTKGFEGFGFEFFEEIAEYTNHKYEYIPCGWEDGFEMLKSGEIDIYGPVGKTEERLKEYLYPDEAFGYEEVMIAALTDSEYTYEDLEAFDGKKIGLEVNSSHRILLDKYVEDNKIELEYVDIVENTDIEDMKSGKYDLRLTGSLHSTKELKVVDKLGVEPFYYIVNKGNEELLEEINYALKKISEEDFLFSSRLQEKYYVQAGTAKPTLSKDDQKLLEKLGKLKVGFVSNHKPIQYINEEGNPDGIAIDIMNLIAKDGGLEIEYIPLDLSNSYERNDIDLNLSILNSYIFDNMFYDTKMYLDLPMMLVGEDIEDITADQIVGMLDYCGISKTSVQEMFPGARIQIYDSLSEMTNLLERGEINYILATSIACDNILTDIGIKKYSIYPTDIELPFYITISDNLSIKHIKVFNKLIDRVDESQIDKIIVDNSIEFLPEITLLDFVEEYSLVIAMLIAGVVCLFVFFVLISSKEKRKALTKIIEEDELTGLCTERKFFHEIHKILKTAKANEYILVSLDIDNFQYINEEYGYKKGSAVLEKFSEQISKHFVDAKLIARINADKFIVLEKSAYNKEWNFENEEWKKCVDNIASEMLDDNYRINTSKGVYEIQDPNLDLVYMVDCANSARLLGKEIYGNTIIKFTEEMDRKRGVKNKIVSNMESALLNKEFKVCYQPKINLDSYKIVGAEALVRWLTDDGGQMYPDEFIPIFEKNGFIAKLDYYVFEEVCIFISENRDKLPIPKISINLSGVTLLRDNLIDKLLDIINKYEISIDIIEFEITESDIVDKFNNIIERISQLRKVGFTVSMDDFGSGISSLNRLKDINIDILKIDREFLANALDGRKGIAIIANIIRMAKQLNLLIVAEGVETKAQVELLKNLECDIAQGYYFAKPMLPEMFMKALENNK